MDAASPPARSCYSVGHSRRSLDELLAVLLEDRVAMLCAERLPEHCHRFLICDPLLVHGVEVVHRLGPGEQRSQRINPVRRRQGLQPVYERGVSGQLELALRMPPCRRPQ